MPDGVENSSLRNATIEGTRENSLAEAAIDGRSELDEEKNESEIMNVNFETLCRRDISRSNATLFIRQKNIFVKKQFIIYQITLLH